jgi:tetratricopeptide (TPR) repeat protein
MADKRLALLKRANKLFRQGKTEAAVKEYKNILAIKPDDLEVRRIVGDLQLRQNNVSDAVEQFEWIADHYLKEGFFAKAIAMFKRITRVDPNYEEALFKLGDLYTRQGLVMEAKQIYLDIAEECKRQNNQKKALGMYKKILEFDRHNIKMRTLLADNYLKEGMKENAVDEYVIAGDILLGKKDYRRAEEFLLKVLGKIKDPKIIEKLLACYTAQDDDEKAISLLKELGDELYKNANFLKVLGELHLKKNQVNEAEKIFTKIAEIDPEETEVIMRLGKVYLQREEYDKTYDLFLPVVDKNIKSGKYEEAASLLRFIIASKNTYLPALVKLASIFKISGKTNNLIALYESLIPIYENKGMKDQLKEVLEELIQLSETPFTYEEQLERLTGQVEKEKEEEDDVEREKEFVSFNLRMVEEAVQLSEFEKAVNTLIKAKTTFPRNVEIRAKLFEVLHTMDKVQDAVEEGKELLDLYKALDMRDQYTELFDKLTALKPDDAKILELSGDEKTSIDIDFQPEELVEEMQAISDSHMEAAQKSPEDSASGELMVLEEEQSLDGFEAQQEKEYSKSLSTYLSELDFYINDKYFGEAERLLSGLKQRYAGNKELLDRIDRFEKAKLSEAELADSDADTLGGVKPMELEEKAPAEAPVEEVKSPTEPLIESGADEFVIERSGGGAAPMLGYEDSNVEIHFGDSDAGSEPMELKLSDEEDAGAEPEGLSLLDEDEAPSEPSVEMFPLEPDMEEPAPAAPMPDVEAPEAFQLSEDALQSPEQEIPVVPEVPEVPEEEPVDLGMPFEIERDIAEESHSAQEYEDSKVGMKAPDIEPPEEIVKIKDEPAGAEVLDFEIEFEEPPRTDDTDVLPTVGVDKDQLIQSPSAEPREITTDEHAPSGVDELDLDSIMMDEGGGEQEQEAEASPFKEITGQDIAFDSEEELLAEDDMFLDAVYYEIEKNVAEEFEAIIFWLKEVEKQRTSTIEKNMMEIFDEFKKGVDEKIGQEDYDTRYNLGIAYKEMGLLEEAIHEFLISSKHPLKFFDSAGLLGMCFREKGMFSEAVSWFVKAAESPDRKVEEYLAVKFELVMTYRLQEDFESAAAVAEDIIKMDSGYRNITEIYEEIKRSIALG